MRREARFEDLVVDHAPAVMAYLTRRVDPREDAADVLQGVLVSAWRKLESVPVDGDGARAWLIGAARLELSTHRRGTARRLAATERLRADVALERLDHDSGATSDRVERALGVLGPEDREIVTLTYWDGLTSDQVADVMGMRSAAVRKRLERARARLARALDTRTTVPAARRGEPGASAPVRTTC